jgi:MFS transporter, MHS family, proline/betaine transporter
LLGVGGFVLRKKLHETASFLKTKARHRIMYSPVKAVFTKHLNHTLFGLVLPVFDTVLFSVLSVMPLYYAQDPFNLTHEQTILLMLISTGLGVVLLPLIGRVSAKYMKFPWLKVSAWGVFMLSFFLYRELKVGHLWSSLFINLAMVFFLSIQAAILPSILAKLFPVDVRYTGIAFSFNICDGVLWTIMTTISFLILSKNSPAFVLFLPLAALLFLLTLHLKGDKGVVGSLLK